LEIIKDFNDAAMGLCSKAINSNLGFVIIVLRPSKTSFRICSTISKKVWFLKGVKHEE